MYVRVLDDAPGEKKYDIVTVQASAAPPPLGNFSISVAKSCAFILSVVPFFALIASAIFDKKGPTSLIGVI